MTFFVTEGGTTKNNLYICRKKLVENLDIRQLEQDEKVQNFKKKQKRKKRTPAK